MGSYYAGYNTFLSNNLDDKFDTNLKNLAQSDGRDILAELNWIVDRELLRRELEQYSIDQELRNLQDKLEESNRRCSIQLSINEEMKKIHKLIDENIREQQEGMKDAGNLGR